jgi:hypothetical protein
MQLGCGHRATLIHVVIRTSSPARGPRHWYMCARDNMTAGVHVIRLSSEVIRHCGSQKAYTRVKKFRNMHIVHVKCVHGWILVSMALYVVVGYGHVRGEACGLAGINRLQGCL